MVALTFRKLLRIGVKYRTNSLPYQCSGANAEGRAEISMTAVTRFFVRLGLEQYFGWQAMAGRPALDQQVGVSRCK